MSVYVRSVNFYNTQIGYLYNAANTILELKSNPDGICGRVLTINRKNEEGTLDDLAMLLYTQDKHTGSLNLQSRIMDAANPAERDALLTFIHDEEKSNHPAQSQPETAAA